MISNQGMQLPGTQFYYLDNMDGRITYLGKIHYPLSADSIGVSIFIDLKSRILSEGIGFPELLIDKSMRKPASYKRFNYAKYFGVNWSTGTESTPTITTSTPIVSTTANSATTSGTATSISSTAPAKTTTSSSAAAYTPLSTTSFRFLTSSRFIFFFSGRPGVDPARITP